MNRTILISKPFSCPTLLLFSLFLILLTACTPLIEVPEGYEPSANNTTSNEEDRMVESTDAITETTTTEVTGTETTDIAAIQEQLIGGVWTLTNTNGNDEDASRAAAPDIQATIAFEGGQISGHAGCNRYFGPYTIENNQLVVGPLASTRKSCALAVMEYERTLLAALATAKSFRFDGEALMIIHAEGELVFQR